MLKKFKRSKASPTPTNQAKMSEHLLKLAKDQAVNEAVQLQVVQSYLDMRPKTYAETFFPYFRMAKFMKFISHPLSFVLSFPLTFYFFWTYAFGMEKDTILSIINTIYQDIDILLFLVFLVVMMLVSAILFVFEWAQHIALSTAYKMYYQTKEIQIPLIVVGVAFSIISIVLSSYGAKDIAESVVTVDQSAITQLDTQIADAMRSRKATNTKDAELLKMKDRELAALRAEKYEIQAEGKQDTKQNSGLLLGFALVNEGCIHFATFFLFLYMFRSSKEFRFINDLFRGRDYLGLNFLNISPSSFTDNSSATRPASTTKKTNNSDASNTKASTQHNASITTAIPIKGKDQKQQTQNNGNRTGTTGQKQDQNNGNKNSRTEATKQVKNVVPTTNKAKQKQKATKKKQKKKGTEIVGNFTFKELEKYYKIYNKRGSTSKGPDTRETNRQKAEYIKHKMSLFEAEKVEGKVYFNIADYEQWNSQQKGNN